MFKLCTSTSLLTRYPIRDFRLPLEPWVSFLAFTFLLYLYKRGMYRADMNKADNDVSCPAFSSKKGK